jgi:hypothetical protein
MLRNKGVHIQNGKALSKKRGEVVLARRMGPNEHCRIWPLSPLFGMAEVGCFA